MKAKKSLRYLNDMLTKLKNVVLMKHIFKSLRIKYNIIQLNLKESYQAQLINRFPLKPRKKNSSLRQVNQLLKLEKKFGKKHNIDAVLAFLSIKCLLNQLPELTNLMLKQLSQEGSYLIALSLSESARFGGSEGRFNKLLMRSIFRMQVKHRIYQQLNQYL